MEGADQDERFMRFALREARKGLGHTSPNPAVGAVLVAGNEVVAAGFHRGGGHPHAEIECLRKVTGSISTDATLYITLEPCSTVGRTPPCTRAIAQAGVRNAVIGAVDVNPRHSGRGIEALREAGVRVRTGILARECSALNEAFNKWIQTRSPFVIAKCGMSLDGRLTRPPGEEQWITSPAARRHANQFRAHVDAILVGAQTIRDDNPRLTVREVRGARQPWRVILTRSERLPKKAHVFMDKFSDRTLVFRNEALEAVLKKLGEKEITSVLIEGGGNLLSQALDARLVDRVRIYLGPRFTGGPVIAFSGRGAASTESGARLREVRYEKIGHDIFVTAQTAYEDPVSE